MKSYIALEARDLPTYSFKSDAPLFWGMLGLIAVEATVFASLIVSYFYLQFNQPWPPAGSKLPDLMLPTISTLLLLASTIPVHWADKSMAEGNQRALRIGLTISTVLALVFLALKAIEYSDVEFRWDTHSYGSIVWAIVIFHSTHVTAVVLKTIVMLVLAWGGGYFSSTHRIGVTVNGLYWYFVAAVWLPLYFVLYWAPRLLSGPEVTP